MICPECNGKGEVKYYREVDRDENSVTVEGRLDICHTCHGSGKKPMTNADHIRSMTDEELAEWITSFVGRTLKANGLDDEFELEPTFSAQMTRWLKHPYKEEV